MNGISSTLKDEIKKSKDGQSKEKFKFLAAILVTNMMVALLCLPMNDPKTTKTILTKTTHPDHQMMVVPLTALITENNQAAPETPVSLISKDKKVIVDKAWLHEALKTENGLTRFKVEINNKDIVRVSESVDAGMVAVPYVETKKQKIIIKRGSKYEVSI